MKIIKNKFFIVMLIFIFIVLLIIGIFLLFNTVWYNPMSIFEKKFEFKLPNSIKIEKQSFYYFNEETLYMKASFDEDDYIKLRDNLQIYFNKRGYELKSDEIIPTFIYACSWWDMNKDDIIIGYHALTSGKHSKTNSIYVFITKNEEDQYFLYVKH